MNNFNEKKIMFVAAMTVFLLSDDAGIYGVLRREENLHRCPSLPLPVNTLNPIPCS